jgi:hypothetical protein
MQPPATDTLYQMFQEHIYGDTARLQEVYTMGRPYGAERDALSDISGVLCPRRWP